MKKVILYGLSAAMLLSLTACGQQAEQPPEQNPDPLATTTASPEPSETVSPKPSETASPEPSTEQPPEETPETANPQQPVHPTPEWEEPPVMTVYNPEADINSDGHVDKSEWEEWIANHPEDLDQDLIVTDEELAAAQDPTGEAAESIKPVTPEELEQQAKDNNVYDPTELIEEPQPGEQYSTYDPVLGDGLADIDEWLAGEGANAAKGGDHSGEPGAVRDEHGNWTVPGHRVS